MVAFEITPLTFIPGQKKKLRARFSFAYVRGAGGRCRILSPRKFCQGRNFSDLNRSYPLSLFPTFWKSGGGGGPDGCLRSGGGSSWYKSLMDDSKWRKSDGYKDRGKSLGNRHFMAGICI